MNRYSHRMPLARLGIDSSMIDSAKTWLMRRAARRGITRTGGYLFAFDVGATTAGRAYHLLEPDTVVWSGEVDTARAHADMAYDRMD